MKMGTIASLWRYDDRSKNASGTMFMRRGCRQHYADQRA
jgi:hypothetical protein